MDPALPQLLDSLRQAVPMLVRSAPATNEYLEGILSRQDLSTCFSLLSQVLGPPLKDFGKPLAVGGELVKLLDRIGGVRPDQCLFLKQSAQGTTYATLWPWASDPARITLKVGLAK